AVKPNFIGITECGKSDSGNCIEVCLHHENQEWFYKAYHIPYSFLLKFLSKLETFLLVKPNQMTLYERSAA
ncbi:hypothetical protein, partial [Salmonella sp. s51933]|uniref:hypothetical protein n=1 Tax=Salmonella sp. s51933 TaxID=3160127 RepID=UPI0037547E73